MEVILPKEKFKTAIDFGCGAGFFSNELSKMGLVELILEKSKYSKVSICGWDKACDVPHESSFSRAFKEFSESGLSQIVHESLIKQYVGDKIIGHISRNSTSIDAREKPVRKNIKISKQKMKRV